MAKTATEAKAPKVKAEKPAKEPRKVAGFPKTAKITVVASENPKRQGSLAHTRFAKYKTGQTIEAFIAAGGTAGDVKWDLEAGHIKIAA